MNETFFQPVMKKILVFGLALLGWLAIAEAKEVPARPTTLVNDYAQLLGGNEVFALEKKLRAYNDSTSTQIAIVIDRSLEGEDPFEYALAIAEKWQVGQAGKDNGIFIYLALNERKIQILAGQGVQGFLPDAEIGRIIREILQPAFRANQYYAGLDRAVDRIIGLGNGEFKAEKPASSGSLALVLVLLIVFGVMVIFYFLSKRGQTQGYSSDGSYRYDGNRRVYRRDYHNQGGGGWIFFPPTFGGGSGSGWSGSSGDSDFGGFDGFGGGDFDGGGAGGDW